MHRTRPAYRNSRSPRKGFTLVEIIVVIVIIAILAALILPALQGAFSTTKNAVVVVEIRGLETAINSFKVKYGVEPPSSIVISTNATGWNSNPAGKAIIRRIWPQFDFSMPQGSFPTWWTGTGVADGNGNLKLNSGECMVFFLGGVMPTEDGPPIGFSANPARPFSPDGGSRVPPFFEFDIGRFTDIDGNHLKEYADSLPGRNKKPYLYFSSYEGSGYRMTGSDSEVVGLASLGISFSDIYRQSSTSGLKPGTATASLPPHKPQGFQIISPGVDGEYGAGGVYNPDLPDSGLVDLSSPPRPDKDSFDNITNFSSGPLRK